jgi:hypothetical protein
MMIFSPAVGGSRKEETTNSIVIRQGRMIAHLQTTIIRLQQSKKTNYKQRKKQRKLSIK